LNRLDCENIDVRSNAPELECDFRGQYLMNSHITGIDDTDLLVLVGTNPKLECPVFNARIRRAQLVNGLEVAVIGPANNLTYNYNHLGNSLQTLQELADGTHPYSDRLAEAELPMIVVGGETLTRTDSKSI
jgi:NADH dehydrogenase (ubiquinone) Fe-S protein 1